MVLNLQMESAVYFTTHAFEFICLLLSGVVHFFFFLMKNLFYELAAINVLVVFLTKDDFQYVKLFRQNRSKLLQPEITSARVCVHHARVFLICSRYDVHLNTLQQEAVKPCYSDTLLDFILTFMSWTNNRLNCSYHTFFVLLNFFCHIIWNCYEEKNTLGNRLYEMTSRP